MTVMLPDGTLIRESMVELGGLALYVAEAGPADGLPVILLHGFPEFWRGWSGQIGPLARAGYRVIVPDQRGYGLSTKPKGAGAYQLCKLGGDVLALAHTLGLKRVRLIGHDWGGIIAFWVASSHPDFVERLAVLNAPHPDVVWRAMRADPVQIARSWYVAFFRLPWLPERLLSRDDYAWLKRLLIWSSRAGTFPPDELSHYEAAWNRPGALTAMLGWYRALVRHPPTPVGRVSAPTLILWGQRDVALGPAMATESLAMCDDGRIAWFDATHWVQHEEAHAVNAALIAHLDGNPEKAALK